MLILNTMTNNDKEKTYLYSFYVSQIRIMTLQRYEYLFTNNNWHKHATHELQPDRCLHLHIDSEHYGDW